MSLSLTSVRTLYSSVIDGVISGVREYFQDEGVDEQVLMELKHIWETRLKATKAVEPKNDKEVHPPVLKPNQATKTALTNHLTHTPQQAIPMDISATKNVGIQITLPAQQNVPDAQPRIITIQVPSTALTGNQLTNALSGPIIAATLALPQHLAQSLLQQHVTTVLNQQSAGVIQLQAQHIVQQTSDSSGFSQAGGVRQIDGHNDTSDEDEEENEEEDDNVDDDDDDDADIKDDEENDENEGGAEEEPLNSGDDVSEEDPTELFDTENVVVCQYDKITRTRNKWKFYLKDGIMNLGGKDYVFQKSNGDAEW